MNVSDQILDEIKERWGLYIDFLDKNEKSGAIVPSDADYTIPARDIRYLLNRLEAAEKAARATAALNAKLWKKLVEKIREVENVTRNPKHNGSDGVV